MSLIIHDQPLPYVAQLAERANDAVTLVVIHCTELPDLATARAYGERVSYEDGTGASGHYYIDRDGGIYCYVPGNRTAHHVRGHNAYSIGIELVNLGRYPDWWHCRQQTMTEPYTGAQISALLALLAHLGKSYPNLHAIAGHQDLDTERIQAHDDPTQTVPRKLDPGPLFPWADILAGCRLRRIGQAAAT